MPLPQKLQICKLGDIRAIRRPLADCSTKNDESRKDSLQEYNSSTPWIEHEIIALLQKLNWEQKEKNVKKMYGMYTLLQKEDKDFLYEGREEVYKLFRQPCQRSRSNYRDEEMEEGESSNSLTT